MLQLQLLMACKTAMALSRLCQLVTGYRYRIDGRDSSILAGLISSKTAREEVTVRMVQLM